ncbi:MAG: thioesterase family protein [Bacteroidetes bacterium]|nr:thioesterase family protein [Bacteroidota bacterium]
MARIKFSLPEAFPFATDIRVRVTDANYAGHLGNDSVLSLVHEARDRCLRSYGFTELNVAGASIIMSDAAIMYRSEAYPGETLRVEVAVGDVHRKGCDFFYRCTCIDDGREVARVKTGVVFYNFAQKKMLGIPQEFLDTFGLERA